MLLNFIFVIVNILILVVGFLLIKNKLYKLTVNQDILESIKKEINLMIVKLNETTVNNITLVEEKTKDFERLIRLADRKKSGLDIKIEDTKDAFEKNDQIIDNLTYSPQKIVKQNRESSENLDRKILHKDEMVDQANSIDELLKDLPVREKIKLLFEEGYTSEEIRKKLKLSPGEFELILNFEGLR